MDGLRTIGNRNPSFYLIFRILICAMILSVGIGGYIALAGLKKAPAEALNSERPLKVAVMKAFSEPIEIKMIGYGEARPLKEVKLSAEVAGQVVAIHPRLQVGQEVRQGDMLFQIDPRNYEVALTQARAEAVQLASVLARLKKQAAIDAERLKNLNRSRDLAADEFKRMRSLLDTHNVGTRSGVDRAEQAYNGASDQADQIAQAVSLYPLRINETESSMTAARARIQQAEINLQRCRVTAPFNGRIKSAAVEQGQYVAPGQALLTLADDTLLEIQVQLDSRDVREGLLFENTQDRSAGAWFDGLQKVACRIRWSEAADGQAWQGQLNRVVDFDPRTRTVTVAVRVSADEARQSGLPLVEGMFCTVEIPGRTLPRAFRVPQKALALDNTLYVVVDQRLKTVPVKVARSQGDTVFVVGGIQDGDTIITTRLVDPLEHALVDAVMPHTPETKVGSL